MPRRSSSFSRAIRGRGRHRRLPRPHDPASPGRAAHLAIGRRRRSGAPARDRVVADFRSADVAAGGEGAPLAPLYHAALAAQLPKPVAVLNLGGVANVTWIGDGTAGRDILAFDTGPGNALIDDWVRRHTGAAADIDGALAGAGRASEAHVARFLQHAVFRPPAAEIARPRRFPRCDARGSFVGGRRRDPDRDDRRRGRRSAPPFSGAGARVAGLRRRAAQPGADGGAGPPPRRPGARRSRRSAGTATRSKRRPSPISRCAPPSGCRSACRRPPGFPVPRPAAGCFPAADRGPAGYWAGTSSGVVAWAKAGMTSLPKRSSCSRAIALGTPTLRLTETRSSPG